MAVYPTTAPGKLPLAPEGDATWHLTQDEFHWLVCGVDWQQVKGHDRKMGIPEEPEDAQSNAITQ